MLTSLYVYVPTNMHAFDAGARTWVVDEKCGKEIDLWLKRVIEDINPTVEFFCARNEAIDAVIQESYRTLHVLPSAPWQVVRDAYLSLVRLCHEPGGDTVEQLERINKAYETLRSELQKDGLEEERQQA
jgi:hypothetical protein